MKIIIISESEFSIKGHGVHTAYVELVSALKKRTDIELVVNKFESADIRHIHTVGTYALAHLLFGSGKKIVSAHVLPESFVGSFIGARYWLSFARFYLRWFYNRADCVLAVSDETKKGLIKLGVTSRVELFYNVIDTTRYQTDDKQKQQARHKLGIESDDWVVTSNGQVQPRKRVDTFLQLARDLPETRFIWIGGIPFKNVAAEYSAMKELIDSAPANVTFTDVIPIEKVRDYLQASDVFISTSDQETFGIAIVEAGATGLPLVLRDISDYDNTFRGEALLCQEAEFADQLEKLRTDKNLYKQTAQRAKRLAKRFDSSRATDRLLEIYRSVLSLKA